MSISGKKRPSSDILQNVHIQIEQETRDGGFTNPPTKRSRLAEDDQSSVRKVGNSENLARMVDMTGFRGLGQTPNINQMALLNPRPGPLDRFKQAGSTRFDDDGPRVFDGHESNQSATVHMNATPLIDKAFTMQALGEQQLVFIQRKQDVSAYQERDRDACFCSLSMLNLILRQAAEPGGRKAYANAQEILKDWIFWGVINNVYHTGNNAKIKHIPIVNSVVRDVARTRGIWCACVPPPRQNAFCWLILVRRGKGELAGRYTDILREIEYLTAGKHTAQSKQKIADCLAALGDLDEETKEPKNHYWRFEPWVMLSSEEPPSYVTAGTNWVGYAIRVGFIVHGALGLQEPAAYNVAVNNAMYPDSTSTQTMQESFYKHLPVFTLGVNTH